MIWDGLDELTPAHQESVPLINGLKAAAGRRADGPGRSDPWELMIPTSLVTIQDDSCLPCRD